VLVDASNTSEVLVHLPEHDVLNDKLSLDTESPILAWLFVVVCVCVVVVSKQSAPSSPHAWSVEQQQTGSD